MASLMPRIMWPLTVYEEAMSHVQAMERKINKHMKKWLGVPNNLSNVAIHSSKAKLTLLKIFFCLKAQNFV